MEVEFKYPLWDFICFLFRESCEVMQVVLERLKNEFEFNGGEIFGQNFPKTVSFAVLYAFPKSSLNWGSLLDR